MQTKQEKRNQPMSGPKLLEIRREFRVPVARLFESFVTADALKAWWWPNGLQADRIDFDFREGGRYFISMKGQVQGKDASGGMTGEFEEIVDNKRIVMTDSFRTKRDAQSQHRRPGCRGNGRKKSP